MSWVGRHQLIPGKIQKYQFTQWPIGESLIVHQHHPSYIQRKFPPLLLFKRLRAWSTFDISISSLSTPKFAFVFVVATVSFTIRSFHRHKMTRKRSRRSWKFWFSVRRSGSRCWASGIQNQQEKNCQSESTKVFQTKCAMLFGRSCWTWVKWWQTETTRTNTSECSSSHVFMVLKRDKSTLTWTGSFVKIFSFASDTTWSSSNSSTCWLLTASSTAKSATVKAWALLLECFWCTWARKKRSGPWMFCWPTKKFVARNWGHCHSNSAILLSYSSRCMACSFSDSPSLQDFWHITTQY